MGKGNSESLAGYRRTVGKSPAGRERVKTYPNTIVPLEVPYNGDTSRGDKGIDFRISSFALETPNIHPFDFSATRGSSLILHSIPITLPLSLLVCIV